MKKILALLLLSPLAFADMKDELNGKILINSSAFGRTDSTSQIEIKKDNELYAVIEGHGTNGVKTWWNGAYKWDEYGNTITLMADTNKCKYFVEKVGNHYSFNIAIASWRSYSNICPNLLMKIKTYGDTR